VTHSGHGDERQHPAARPAHEGVVLPGDGSEPWIPGSTPEQVAPAGGQPWGQPWGPQGGHQGGQQDHQQDGHQQDQGGYRDPQQGYGDPGQGDAGSYGRQEAPQYGQDPSYGAPEAPPYGEGAPYGGGSYGYPQQEYGHQQPPQHQQHQLPPQQHQPPEQQHQLPPQQHQQHQLPQQYQQPQQPQPLPLPSDPSAHGASDATQYLPLPPAQNLSGMPGAHGMPPGGDADATQFIAPVPGGPGPGMLPPEHGAGPGQFLGGGPGSDADATQFIAPVPAQDPHPAAGAGAGQYDLRPGAPEDRQPPAEFDSLFRPAGSAGQDDQSAGSTQQMPKFDQSRPPQQPQQPYGRQPAPYQQPGGYEPQGASYDPPGQHPHDAGGRGGGGGRRKSSRLPLIALGVVAIAAIGLGAGALMSGGDDTDKDHSGTVASTSSPGEAASAQPGEDPAKPQAEALDKLLADSNNSRSAVIGAVGHIKSCDKLDSAAQDLRGAAGQRRDLVTRLKGLKIDKLPDSAELASSLTTAWQASASADDHYAQWATQAKSGKVCKGGHPRRTQAAAEGDKSSGDATAAKNKASGLWNGIATKYGLTQRASSQL
jgi:hypothetical protein